MKQFNQQKTLDKINAYIIKHYTNDPVPVKDFYNLYTGEMTCGRCNKTMSGWKALFHFHLKWKKPASNKKH